MSYGVFRRRFDLGLYRRLPWVPTYAVAGQTVVIGQATETDTAQSVTVSKTRAVGQAIETDTAQPITEIKTRAIGQASETDSAQSVTAYKTRTIGQATETDTAQPVTVLISGTVVIGQAVETDTAQPVTVTIAGFGTQAIGGAPPWYTEAWRRKKYRAWPLPPPAFPLLEEAPPTIIEVGGPVTSPKAPEWLKAIKKKPLRVVRGLQYRAPKIVEPVAPDLKIKELPAAIEVEKPQSVDDIIREWRRMEEEELITMLVMQGAL